MGGLFDFAESVRAKVGGKGRGERAIKRNSRGLALL